MKPLGLQDSYRISVRVDRRELLLLRRRSSRRNPNSCACSVEEGAAQRRTFERIHMKMLSLDFIPTG